MHLNPVENYPNNQAYSNVVYAKQNSASDELVECSKESTEKLEGSLTISSQQLEYARSMKQIKPEQTPLGENIV